MVKNIKLYILQFKIVHFINIKFIHKFSGIKYIHTVLQPSSPSIFRTLFLQNWSWRIKQLIASDNYHFVYISMNLTV